MRVCLTYTFAFIEKTNFFMRAYCMNLLEHFLWYFKVLKIQRTLYVAPIANLRGMRCDLGYRVYFLDRLGRRIHYPDSLH